MPFLFQRSKRKLIILAAIFPVVTLALASVTPTIMMLISAIIFACSCRPGRRWLCLCIALPADDRTCGSTYRRSQNRTIVATRLFSDNAACGCTGCAADHGSAIVAVCRTASQQ